MKYIKNLLIAVIAVASMACGDDGPDANENLLTYSVGSNEFDDGERLIIVLTDSEGNLIESEELVNGQTSVFSNEAKLIEYTLSEITIFPRNGSVGSIFIRTFANTTVADFRRDGNTFADEEQGSVTFNVSDDFNGTLRGSSSLLSGNNTSIFPPSTLINIGTRNPSLYLTYESTDSAPLFQLFPDLSPGEELSLDINDFAPLSTLSIQNELTAPSYRSLSISGQRNEFGFVDIPISSFVSFTDLSESDPTILYPENTFDNFLTTLSYFSGGNEYGFTRFGQIPNHIPAPELEGEIISLEIDNQEIQTSGDVHRITTIWTENLNIENEDYVVTWIQNWPQSLPVFEAPTIVHEIATGSLDLDALRFIDATVHRYTGISSYDEVVALFGDTQTDFSSTVEDNFRLRLR